MPITFGATILSFLLLKQPRFTTGTLARWMKPMEAYKYHLASRVARRVSRVACRVSRVVCRVSRVARRVSRVARRVSRVACRASRVAGRVSRVARRASRPKITNFQNLKNDAVSLSVVIETSNKKLNRGIRPSSTRFTRLLSAKMRYTPLKWVFTLIWYFFGFSEPWSSHVDQS